MSQFHPLTVTDIHHTIRDAVVLTLKGPQVSDLWRWQQSY